MKKLITKMLSLTLALAMCLSVTALAASDADIIAQREANPNWHAVLNFLHEDQNWISVKADDYDWNRGGPWKLDHFHQTEIHDGQRITSRVDDINGKTFHIEWNKFHKEFHDYESPYGNVVETWAYINDNFDTSAANGWLDMLRHAYNANPCDHNKDKRPSAQAANMQLTYLTTEYDNDMVRFLETYGRAKALEFARLRTNAVIRDACGHPPEDGYLSCNHSQCGPLVVYPYETVLYSMGLLRYEDWLQTPYGVRLPGDPDYGKPIVKTPELPVANAQAPVETVTPVEKAAPANGAVMTTITVNDKPVEFEAVLKNNTTYLKLRDIGTSTGFNVNWDGKSIAISRTDVFAAKTTDVRYFTKGTSEQVLPAGTVATRIIVEGQPYELESVVLTDANGGATTYFKLRNIATLMHFGVGWNADTGVSIYND